jgi:hypothetical protein
MFQKLTIDELLSILDTYNHAELHVHHTWKPDHSDFDGSNHQALQTAMRNYHVNTRGWSDIGQHVTLFPDGAFLNGRDFGVNPASIKGYNSGAFCVEMIGNFDVGHDVLEGDQLASIIKLARYFNEKKKYIRFHRENASKTCPGTSINKEDFMQMVKGESPKLSQYDAVKIISFLSAGYNVCTTKEDKAEFHRLANEIRRLAGLKVGD